MSAVANNKQGFLPDWFHAGSKTTRINTVSPLETTIGIEFGSTELKIQDKIVKLQIWVHPIGLTKGHSRPRKFPLCNKRYRNPHPAYYRNAIGCLLVFDILRRETFTHLQNWLDDVKAHSNDMIKLILVANKCDQESKRQVSQNLIQVTRQEAETFASINNMTYIEVSAKSGRGVEEVHNHQT